MYAYYQPYWTSNCQEDELEHFGIKGMKWGIRRYQNPDGTLTEAGKKRYGNSENLQADYQKKKEMALKIAKTSAKVVGGLALSYASTRLIGMGVRAVADVIDSWGYVPAARLDSQVGENIVEHIWTENIQTEHIEVENIIRENMVTENVIRENIIPEKLIREKRI